MRIGIRLSTYYLKATSTPLDGSLSSVISGITTPFLLRNIDRNYYSIRNSTQFQSSNIFPDHYIDVEGKNLIPTFDNKSLKKVTLKSTTIHQCSTSKTVKSNSYLTSPSFHYDNTSDNFSNATYELYVPSIDNGW